MVLPVQMAGASGATGTSAPVPPEPGQQLHLAASISELPVPPTVPASGACANPTGCLSGIWGGLGSPGFYWDSHYVLVGLTYAGAPTTGDASIYSGPQVVLDKTDGTTFADGDAWKCLTCGVAMPSTIVTTDFTYPPPRALPGDRQVLAGNGILDCTGPSGALLTLSDPECTPADTHIFPIYWGSSPLGASSASSPFGNGREWRLSPDGVHLEWDSLLLTSAGFTEDEFEGALSWDSPNQRYDLTNVYFLPQPTPWVVQGDHLVFQPQAMIGEARGWTSDGRSILGIQSYEDNSIDGWATNLATGQSRPVTDHAEYTDPMQMSPNGLWMINDEAKGNGRMDWISGLEGISPIASNLVSLGVISQMRNNGNRRFFEPWLTSTVVPSTEQVNAAVADPDWNAAADPVWLADSAAVVWVENFACGANPTLHQCPGSTEPGGRNSRLMIARFPLAPSPAIPPTPISNTTPAAWAIPYTPGQTVPTPAPIPSGTYTVQGNVTGNANVVIADNSTGTAIQSIQVTYHNYVQARGLNIVNGTESVNTNTPGFMTWNDNLTVIGLQGIGHLVTSPGGFSVNINDLNFSNNFQATGTMTTTLNGSTYTQPANGT
jgi:hypothetical protein